MATTTKKKVDITVMGLGGTETHIVPKTLTVAELKELTNMGNGGIRIDGENGLKDSDSITLKDNTTISKEIPDIEHGNH